MKNMKIKTLSATFVLALLAVGASAQPQGGRQGQGARQQEETLTAEKTAEIKTDKMDQVLDLSDSQESKIYKLNLKYAEEQLAKKSERTERTEGEKSERPDKEAMKAKMTAQKEAVAAQNKAIMLLLDDEQKIKYAMMLAQTKGKGQGQQGQKMQQGRRGQQGKGQMQRGGQGKMQQGKGSQSQKGQRGEQSVGQRRTERGEGESKEGRAERPQRRETTTEDKE